MPWGSTSRMEPIAGHFLDCLAHATASHPGGGHAILEPPGTNTVAYWLTPRTRSLRPHCLVEVYWLLDEGLLVPAAKSAFGTALRGRRGKTYECTLRIPIWRRQPRAEKMSIPMGFFREDVLHFFGGDLLQLYCLTARFRHLGVHTFWDSIRRPFEGAPGPRYRYRFQHRMHVIPQK